MQKRRTHHFKVTLSIVTGASSLLLLILAMFGSSFTIDSLDVLINCIFTVLGLAAASFLMFSFVPYFRGDKRWYSISALLTVAFFIGTAIIWRVPAVGMVL